MGFQPQNKNLFRQVFLKRNFIFLGVFVAGLVIVHQYDLAQTKRIISTIVPLRENNFNYKYIYPLLSYSLNDALPFLEDGNLSKKLNDYVDGQYKDKNAGLIGIYYRNLIDNSWAGVNEDVQLHPGSMMKIVIMMGYYRQQQLDPSVLNRNLAYSYDVSQAVKEENFATPSSLVLGKSYTVRYLIDRMIKDSDNGAELLLVVNADQKILNSAYDDLKLGVPSDSNYTISPKQFSAFLRILYNSTYLTELNSEEALKTMNGSGFVDGITAGVPKGIVVVQKYGERVNVGTSGDPDSVELSNCGIVYGKNPYQLCVMTKSLSGYTDIEPLKNIIKDVSKIIYDYTTERAK